MTEWRFDLLNLSTEEGGIMKEDKTEGSRSLRKRLQDNLSHLCTTLLAADDLLPLLPGSSPSSRARAKSSG
jgi:hypothetical protein